MMPNSQALGEKEPGLDEPVATLPTGKAMPLFGLGTWALRGNGAYEALLWAFESGYRHFDTATMYRNEAELGRALRDSPVARADVFITTKLPPHEAGNERRTLERSLSALGVDHVDLWLVHWPPNGAGVDTWTEFARLAEEGLAGAIGVSNYSPGQIDELIDKTGVVPAVNQIRWSPFIFDGERLEHSRSRGVVLEGYSPFRSANLAHPLLAELGGRYGKTPAQIILRWHLDHGVAVIPKSARRERIESNIDVFDFSLTSEEVAAVDRLSGKSRFARN
jgi:2,5-diketo-D-gluconate reductase A